LPLDKVEMTGIVDGVKVVSERRGRGEKDGGERILHCSERKDKTKWRKRSVGSLGRKRRRKSLVVVERGEQEESTKLGNRRRHQLPNKCQMSDAKPFLSHGPLRGKHLPELHHRPQRRKKD